MSDPVKMLEATLDLMEEGVAILDEQSNVLFWNKAAAALTGYLADAVIGRQCPADLYHVDEQHRNRVGTISEVRRRAGQMRSASGYGGEIAGYSGQSLMSEAQSQSDEQRDESLPLPTLVLMKHKLGHSVPGMLRRVELRDLQNVFTGSTLLFYPVEEVDALPHGETGEGIDIERSQANMEDRLDAAHHQWITSGMPFGLLWITVDQARSLRKTHGRDACESMLRTVEQTLLRQMNPSEVLGRWGDNEYLVLAHERTAELLREHAQRLVGQARTADFRWWGDRVGLTVSIGVIQAIEGDALPSLLSRARRSMHASEYAGGNRVTEARGI
jgi:diguanylate cyclase (GGDEF)-like protein